MGFWFPFIPNKRSDDEGITDWYNNIYLWLNKDSLDIYKVLLDIVFSLTGVSKYIWWGRQP
jgi:hypothetical protein